MIQSSNIPILFKTQLHTRRFKKLQETFTIKWSSSIPILPKIPTHKFRQTERRTKNHEMTRSILIHNRSELEYSNFPPKLQLFTNFHNRHIQRKETFTMKQSSNYSNSPQNTSYPQISTGEENRAKHQEASWLLVDRTTVDHRARTFRYVAVTCGQASA